MNHPEHAADALAVLAPVPTNDRRQALRSGLALSALGYAAAAGPAVAQTAIKTPSAGLRTGEAVVAVGSHSMPVFFAAPASGQSLPVVLVLSEIFGVHEYIADTCRRFAQAGYLAIAPEFFGRHGDPTSYGEVSKLVAEVINKVPDAQVLADAQAALDWAFANGGDANRVAVTGFCWGGRQTWLLAAGLPQVKAAVAWYGRLVGTPSALQPKHPVDVAVDLRAPVLGLYGEKDTGIALSTVEQMKTALAAGSAPARSSEFVVYPDAPHGFHADYRPMYRAEAAADGFRRCVAWFKRFGV